MEKHMARVLKPALTAYFVILLLLAVSAQTRLLVSEDTIAKHTQEIHNYWNDRFQNLFADTTFALTERDRDELSYYIPNYEYRIEAQVQLLIGEKPFQMPTYAGTTNEYIRYAIAKFTLPSGEQTTLTLYRSTRLFADPMYKGHLFAPFLDATNGVETYGGGRYLDLSTSDIQNGKIVIDFNKAYNPLCAYSSGYRCPIPPPENHFLVPIYAGELKYTGEIKERPIVK